MQSSERYLIAVAAMDHYRYCGCNCGRYHRYLLPCLRGCTGPPQEVARSLDGYSLPAARPRRGSLPPRSGAASFIPAVRPIRFHPVHLVGSRLPRIYGARSTSLGSGSLERHHQVPKSPHRSVLPPMSPSPSSLDVLRLNLRVNHRKPRLQISDFVYILYTS
jgi:hypothetical protein